MKGPENLFEEIVAENFPNLWNKTDIQTLEAKRVPKNMNSKNPTPRHSMIKMLKVKHKEKILNAARKTEQKHLLHIKETHKTISRFLSRNFIGQKWHGIFKVLKGKNFQPRILCIARLSFINEG